MVLHVDTKCTYHPSAVHFVAKAQVDGHAVVDVAGAHQLSNQQILRVWDRVNVLERVDGQLESAAHAADSLCAPQHDWLLDVCGRDFDECVVDHGRHPVQAGHESCGKISLPLQTEPKHKRAQGRLDAGQLARHKRARGCRRDWRQTETCWRQRLHLRHPERLHRNCRHCKHEGQCTLGCKQGPTARSFAAAGGRCLHLFIWTH